MAPAPSSDFSQRGYVPLTSKTCTRVLTLQPGVRDSFIEASVTEVDLANHNVRDYECCSYRWDDKDHLEAEDYNLIYLNGLTFYVMPKLHAFLVKLRAQSAPRTIWADYICINQSSNETATAERNAQVAQMGKIYSRATRVLAWVGEHAAGSEQLFQGWGPKGNPSSERLYRWTGGKLSHSKQHYRKLVWTPFLQRDYFTRTWIVQELALAKHVDVYCGDNCMNWDDLIQNRLEFPSMPTTQRIRRKASRLFRDTTTLYYDLDGIKFERDYSDQLHLVRTVRTYPIPSSLTTLMNDFGVITNCSGTRDKVFGFLSMAGGEEDRNARPILVNTKTSMAELLLQLWLRKVDSGELKNPAPYMAMLKFMFEDDCQFVDYLLDGFEAECAHSLYNKGYSEPGVRGVWSNYYVSWLDAVQALWDSSVGAKNMRLCHKLPGNGPWRGPAARGHGGRKWLTAAEREADNQLRGTQAHQNLLKWRTELMARGDWIRTQPFSRYNLTGVAAMPEILDRLGPSLDHRTFLQYRNGSQPIQVIEVDGTNRHRFERPGMVENRSSKEAFRVVGIQYVNRRVQDHSGM